MRRPRSGGAHHAGNHDDRPRHRKVRLSGSRRRLERQRNCPSAAEASPRARVLQEAAALRRRDRGLCHVTSLVARTTSSRSYRASHPSGVCEALRQAPEERCCREVSTESFGSHLISKPVVFATVSLRCLTNHPIPVSEISLNGTGENHAENCLLRARVDQGSESQRPGRRRTPSWGQARAHLRREGLRSTPRSTTAR